jgi:polyribonucleotide nucleotidyltransferase
MGLIKLGEDYVVLSDILGDEDHLGDMDFKVTGTPNGITAFQMDTKLGSIPREVMNKAMNQARDGRLHILDKMAEVIDSPREELSPFAPRITTIRIKPDKIRDIIGKGGVVIKEIQSTCDVQISIEDDGRVDVISTNADNAKRAQEWIETIVREPELGEVYLSTVSSIKEVGVVVDLYPGTDMFLHISEWDSKRTNTLKGLVNLGDEILIKVIKGPKGLTASRKAAFGEQAK